MVLDPQGIVLEAAIGLVVIVVVIGVFVRVVTVIVITAVEMVLQLVSALGVRLVGHGITG